MTIFSENNLVASSTGDCVMVVDDEPEVAETTTQMLQNRGIETVTETSPGAVVHAIDDQISCIVSDYMMPDMDGLELLEAVRDAHPELPFILFTGWGSEKIASDAIAAGVDHYLQKSHRDQYDRLANKVEKAIENYQNEQELTKQRRLLETIFETAFDGIFVLDVDERVVVEANPRACELLGYPYEELIGTDIAEIHPEDYEEYLEMGRTLIDTDSRRRVEALCYTRNDSVIPSEITAAPMEYDDQTFLLTIMRPRSDR